jgi:hypothetical protein
VRNRILVMINREIYSWARSLSNDEAFVECISLTDRAISEQYDMDLFFRFLIFRKIEDDELNRIGDLNQFLTDRMIEIIENNELNIEKEEEAFRITFSILQKTIGLNSFRKYDSNKQKFVGGFLVSAFEILALGMGYHYQKYNNLSIELLNEQLIEKIRYAWETQEFTSSSGSGARASWRLPKTIPFGRKLFNPDYSIPNKSNQRS